MFAHIIISQRSPNGKQFCFPLVVDNYDMGHTFKKIWKKVWCHILKENMWHHTVFYFLKKFGTILFNMTLNFLNEPSVTPRFVYGKKRLRFRSELRLS